MRNFIYSIFFCILLSGFANAQITGSAVVCPSYLYDYSVSVPGAFSYNWTLPTGWIIMSGQGTSHINVFCNANIGSVCVDALDSLGALISHSCQSVIWGGASGWDVTKTTVLPCLCDPVAISVAPNTSGCPGSCGTGTQSPNTIFAVYNNPWPGGTYLGRADGIATYPQPGIGIINVLYVYQVDITWGINNAVLISGGSCVTNSNNTVYIYGCSNLILTVNVNPDTVCVGDTFSAIGSIYGNAPLGFNWFTSDTNVTLLGGPFFGFGVNGILTGFSSSPIQLTYSIGDINGCHYFGHGYVIPSSCNSIPSANFISNDTTICPNACINFTNQSMFGTSYHWSFPGGNPASDTATNPHNICYTTAGDFDVTLVATNQFGSDTLTLNNFITVHPVNFSSITESGDTLFVGANYVSYQWYEDSIPIVAATDYFFVPQHNGNYGVTMVDSNGCEGTSFMQGVMVSMDEEIRNNFKFNVFYFAENLVVDFVGSGHTSASIELMNITGEKLYSKKCLLNIGENRINLPGSISPGIYVLGIYTNDFVLFKKFIIN